MDTTLKDNVKRLCKEQGMTLTQLAAKMGINYVTLWGHLTGNPTLSRLLDIAAAIGTTVEEVVAGLGKSQAPHRD